MMQNIYPCIFPSASHHFAYEIVCDNINMCQVHLYNIFCYVMVSHISMKFGEIQEHEMFVAANSFDNG